MHIFVLILKQSSSNLYLPQQEVSAENIDMGQRNQIRGQREREKQAAA